VVFVAVCKHDAAHMLAIFEQVRNVGTTMSTPATQLREHQPGVDNDNVIAQRMAMQFIPNSPSPPSGTICSFPVGIDKLMLAQGELWLELQSADPR